MNSNKKPASWILGAFAAWLVLAMSGSWACSINAAGKCGGSACDEDEVCKKVSDFKCECKPKSELDQALISPVASDDEIQLDNPGRPAWKRMLISANGKGSVSCGKCSTGSGCTEIWIPFNSSVRCQARPAANSKFNHWIVNGNFGGENPQFVYGGKPGSLLVGHFGPALSVDGEPVQAVDSVKRWSLTQDHDRSIFASGNRFDAFVENDSDSESPVNIEINGGVADRLDPGDSGSYEVPVADSGVAQLDVVLQPFGTSATGETRMFTSALELGVTDRRDEWMECDTTYRIRANGRHESCELCYEAVPEPGCPDECPVWRKYDYECWEYPDGTFGCQSVGQCKFEL